MKRLWVVEWRPQNQSVIPSQELSPDFEDAGIDVIVADQFFALVSGEYDTLDRLVGEYPYWKVVGHPSDGKWVSEGGDGVYVYNAELLDSEEELWDALGLEPEMFDGESWSETDSDLVRDQVPTY